MDILKMSKSPEFFERPEKKYQKWWDHKKSYGVVQKTNIIFLLR